MNVATTQNRLINVLNDSLPNGIDSNAVTSEAALNSFGVDSLVLIDLIFDLEQEFGVKLAAQQLMSMKTVGDLTSFLDQRAVG